jgi:hypothetical protein
MVMMFSILLLKLEPLAAPVTPAIFQPTQNRTTLRMLEAYASGAPDTSITRSSHACSRSSNNLRVINHTSG